MSRRATLWAMVAVLLLAAALRLAEFGRLPPGLYHDEAYHGLDAATVLAGDRPLYFPANNGREPLFIYLVAGAVGVLGRSPFALRLPALFAGLLTVAATGALGNALFSRRVGVLAAAVLAVTLWHVHLSRVGFRAVLLPLFTALTLWQGARVSVSHRRRAITGALLAGLFYGLTFYTYTAARFTPVALAVYAALLARRRRSLTVRAAPLLAAVAAALLTLLPLAVYTVLHPQEVLGRPGQVFVWNAAISHGDPWGLLAHNLLATLGMFFWRGDRIWRHNVPWRPVFDPLLGLMFLLGLLVALRRARRSPAALLLIVWTAVMSLPTVLAEDAPHFLRAVGLLPLIALLPALGLDWLWTRLARPRPWLAPLVAVGVLGGGLVSTAWAYFGDYARAPQTAYWFEEGAVGLAGSVNRFLGAGWDGERMLHAPAAGRRVYLERGLWEQWPQVRFLVGPSAAVTLLPAAPPSDLGAGVAVFVWPYGDYAPALTLLPHPAEVSVEEGPLSQGDRDPRPYTTFLAFYARPPTEGTVVARFGAGVELLGTEVTAADGGRVRVRLIWRATAPVDEDYTVFLHYLRDGERIAQGDSRAAGGHYPTTAWRPGDVVCDDHFLVGIGEPQPGRDRLRFGLWRPESGARLPILDEAGNPAGDWLEVPVVGD